MGCMVVCVGVWLYMHHPTPPHTTRWESFAGEDGRPPRFYQLPPPIQPIPVRPLTLDSAQAYLNIPSIKHRYPQQATQQQGEASTASTFARFFTGWGGGAKK